MMIKNLLGSITIIVALVITMAPCFSQSFYNVNNNNNGYYPQPYQGNVSTLAAGTQLSARLDNGLSSAVNRPGDRFYATLTNSIYSYGGIAVPAGSKLEGVITNVSSSGLTGKNGMLEFRIDQLVTPNGQFIPCSASIVTKYGNNIWKGGSGGGRVGKSILRGIIGAGLGAALGCAVSAAAGGSVGKGAIYGTAIGGGTGLVSNVATKGNEANIPSGTPLNIVLNTPLALAPGAVQNNPNGYYPSSYSAPQNYPAYDNYNSPSYNNPSYPAYNNSNYNQYNNSGYDNNGYQAYQNTQSNYNSSYYSNNSPQSNNNNPSYIYAPYPSSNNQ